MLNDRLSGLGDGPFQRLAKLLDGVAPAAGLKPMVLSVGEPRHAYPAFVGDVLDRNRDLYGRYPPATGTPEYRGAVADWLTRRYALAPGFVDAERHVLPLNGTREGLFLLALLVVPSAKGGDRPLVAMPNPFYHPYAGAALAAGAEPRYLPATRETGFLPDLDALTPRDLERLALVYLCSPANPQGSVADRAYLRRLVELARRHDFVVAVDECYAEIYADDPPPGALEVCRDTGSHANVLVFHSLSKRSSVPGLRCGFVAGDPDLLAAFLTFRNYSCAQIPLPIFAAATALWRDEAHVEANRALYRAKFDLADARLAGRFGYARPGGGFFLWLDVGDGEAAARELWARAAVRVLPGGYIARGTAADNPGRRYIRIALVDDATDTAEALERIAATLN